MPHRYARNVTDQRGTGKRLKSTLPPTLFRLATRSFNFSVGLVPDSVKYPASGYLRRRKYPYVLLQDGDTAIQIGAPRDTLRAGRSRAIHFARLVGGGKVLVVEPDAENVAALRAFISRSRLADRVLVAPVGAWKESGDLTLFVCDQHPASNVLETVRPTASQTSGRGYRRITIPVRTVDELVDRHGLPSPKLISITTNGAELQILDGMPACISACQYISLASTGNGYVESMWQRGFRYLARDDRGFLFEHANEA